MLSERWGTFPDIHCNIQDLSLYGHHELCLGEGFFLVDRKSTRLNSSHVAISYAVFCLKKKKNTNLSAVAGLQVARLLHPLGDAGGRAGRDDVGAAQLNLPAEVGDQLSLDIDHVPAVSK